jgi:hypothetical protein
MTKDDALKMAIEALEEAKEQLGGLPQLEKLIQDCKEALENLEKDYSFSRNLQEPVAWQWLKSGHMRKKIPKTATPEHWRPLYTKEQL